MQPKYRPPTTPGEMLLEEFLRPMGMSQVELAKKMGVPIQRVNTIITGKRAISAETALKLSEVFKNSPEFWLGLQMDWDLWVAKQKSRSHPVSVNP
jgi:addiction module HigA family antidote